MLSFSFDWTSELGQIRLTNLVVPNLKYTPFDYQLRDSIPSLVRKDMITLVIEPTNFLEFDMAKNLASKGVSAIAINSEDQQVAVRTVRNLWKEAQECRFHVVAVSPESLQSPDFDKMLSVPAFHKRWGVLVVDEAHLIDEWGRHTFRDIDWLVPATMRAPLEVPKRVVYCDTI
ncbi:hypothetical protein DXG03_002530 [Asterophora parasitica]|uniref:DEAD/DEAH-box helicase domain-containing protein n=1 Tax=Asterophora parasitica TaxID=117018 RepID=A0A9P7G294_9AGAR|nr:hypothetical protein DXG03_002530 [Asterophora parasitica]